MEDVPAVVDLKRTRGTFLDATERCNMFFGGGEEEKKEKEKRRRVVVLWREGVRCTTDKHESEKESKRKVL